MQKMYYVAVMENNEGDRQYLACSDKEIFTTEKKGLRYQGYFTKEYLKTTDRALYYKIRCKIAVAELRDLEVQKEAHYAWLYKAFSEDYPSRKENMLYNEIEEAYIKKVARAYKRFLRINKDNKHKYTDDLAIQCYNYYENKVKLHNIIDRELYKKYPYEC